MIALNIARMIMESSVPHEMSSLGIISIDELIIKGALSSQPQNKECINEYDYKDFKAMHICYIPVLELKELINIYIYIYINFL